MGLAARLSLSNFYIYEEKHWQVNQCHHLNCSTLIMNHNGSLIKIFLYIYSFLIPKITKGKCAVSLIATSTAAFLYTGMQMQNFF